jgi:exodeoxyribonuclease-3
MSLRIATWNINSVRLRIDLVTRFLEQWAPDVLCLQETKCPQGQFPSAALAKLGYTHVAERGQKGYHGVAIVSRLPLADSGSRDFCGKTDSRHICATVAGIDVHNFYVPAGGDEPDPDINEKFAHKLQFLDEMESWFARGPIANGRPALMLGDLNIAPLEQDVWSHKELLKVVSHTPVETDGLKRVQAAGAWIDIMRQHVPPEEKLYTWWSYRARDWEASDRGRRLDHIWASADLAGRSKELEVIREARGWPRASDHVPVIATLDWSP